MGKTRLRQDSQLQASQNYVQNLPPGIALQNNAVSIEDDLNGNRSQQSRFIDATGAANWFDDVPTVNGKKRGLLQLNTSLNTIETTPMLMRVRSAANVTVPAGQNYAILSVATNQAPSLPAAIGLTTVGAVCAQSAQSGAAFAANELTTIAGNDVYAPWNMVLVRNASNGQEIESSDLDVFALLQVESTATDGQAFSDTASTSRVKVSFYTCNFSTMALQPAAAADIGGKSVNLMYTQRLAFSNLPQNAYIGASGFIDNIAGVDVTLTRATTNQAGAGIPVANNVLWQLATGTNFKIQNAAGSTDYVSVDGSGNANMTLTSLNVNSTSVPNFTKGLSAATASQTVNVGVTAGQVDSAGLTLNSTGSNPLRLISGNSMSFKDGYLTGSSYTGAQLPLAASATDWNNAASEYGASASLLSMIFQAGTRANHSIRWATVTAASIASGTNVTGAGGSPNIDTQLFDYTTVPSGSVGSTVKVFYNGVLQRYGATLAAGNDWAPGTAPANGDLLFAFSLKGGSRPDVLTMEIFFSNTYAT